MRTARPDYERCLISLSPGGTDADVVREFDVTTGTFVDGGFTLPEAKSNVAWFDEDTLFVGTDEGEGSLTDSGYPRLVKLWKRGTDFASARQIAEGEQTDVSISGFSVLDGDTRWRFIQRGPSFWTANYSPCAITAAPFRCRYPRMPNSKRCSKAMSCQAQFTATTRNRAAEAWLVAWPLQDVLDGKPAELVVFSPSETAVEEVATSENTLWVKVLDDVSGKLIEVRPGYPGWLTARWTCPATARSRSPTPGTGDTVFVTIEHAHPADPVDGAGGRRGEADRFRAGAVRCEPLHRGAALRHFEGRTRVPYYLARPKARKVRCRR